MEFSQMGNRFPTFHPIRSATHQHLAVCPGFNETGANFKEVKIKDCTHLEQKSTVVRTSLPTRK